MKWSKPYINVSYIKFLCMSVGMLMNDDFEPSNVKLATLCLLNSSITKQVSFKTSLLFPLLC